MKNEAVVSTIARKLFVYKHMTFGEWLRKKIQERDWSNARVARLAGVSPTYIGNLVRDYSPTTLSGKGRPSEDVVEGIAKALNADLNEARLAAGYAPIYSDLSPVMQEIEKQIRVAGKGISDLTEEEMQELSEEVNFQIEAFTKRIIARRERAAALTKN